jgi:sulfite exporter TauE/SafE
MVALLFRSALPLEGLSSWSERLVGVVLIGIGLWGVRRALSLRVHAHDHAHDGEPHRHLHVHHAAGELERDGHAESGAHRHAHAAFGIGVLHGLAGSAHFLGVLPALALPTTAHAVAYVASFGAGTVAAMAAFGHGVAWLARRSAGAGSRAYRGLLATVSAAAVLTGVGWLALS